MAKFDDVTNPFCLSGGGVSRRAEATAVFRWTFSVYLERVRELRQARFPWLRDRAKNRTSRFANGGKQSALMASGFSFGHSTHT